MTATEAPDRGRRDGLVTIAYVHPGEQKACFTASLREVLIFDLGGEQRLLHSHAELPKEVGSGGIVDGRNTCARVMCDESPAEWLWFVDSDAGFDHDTLERLIAAADPLRRPVVGALSFGAKYDGKAAHHGVRYRAYPTIMDFFDLEDRIGFAPRTTWPADELVEVGGTGCHCLLIHRSVLEAVRARYGDCWFDPIKHPKNNTTFSEDLSFCIRVAGCDFPIHVHTGIKTTHDKGFAFLDEDWYFAQERAAGRLVDPTKTPPTPPGPNRKERRAKRRAA